MGGNDNNKSEGLKKSRRLDDIFLRHARVEQQKHQMGLGAKKSKKGFVNTLRANDVPRC